MKRCARAKAKTHNPKSIGYIYRLPNELLHLVFTFLFLSEDASDSGSRTAIFGERVLVLRWVCAWFRTIASQHNRWLEDDFDFKDLFPPPKEKRLPHKLYIIAGYIITLLDDRTLRSCLGQRSSWNFTSHQAFLAVEERGSSFLCNTRRLRVKDVGYFLPLMMTKFGVFTNLTSISITIPTSDEVAINLDPIAKLCPLLEDVALYDLCTYRGSLERLQHVTSLSVEMTNSWDDDWFEMLGFTDLLPVDSASCLTRLSFRIQEYSPLQFKLQDNPFDSFVALTDLTIHEFHPGLFQHITTTKISLLNLTIDLHYDDELSDYSEAALLRLLSATSVKSLRALTITGETVYYFDFSAVAAATHFQYLENLTLDFPILDVSRCGFAEMKNLKFLSLWNYLGEWEDEEDPKMAEKILELRKSFESVFGNRRQKSTRVIVKETYLTSDTHRNVYFDLLF